MDLKKKIYKMFLNDKLFLKLKFKKRLGYKLNLSNPKTFNEKLQWLKLYDRKPSYTKYVDKFLVREYVAETIGNKYLNTLYGTYDSIEEINIDSIKEEKFVLKTTHDSGGVIVFNENMTRGEFNEQLNEFDIRLKNNYYYASREYPYKNVKPRIVCEKYLEDNNGELLDYKLFCFNGKVKLIQVDIDRHGDHKRNMYDVDWERMNINYIYNQSEQEIRKPLKLKELIHCAEKLSENLLFCRVDFYIVNNEIKFGELTFFPEAGFGKFDSYQIDLSLGKLIDLNQ